jgi:hypothetical protein
VVYLTRSDHSVDDRRRAALKLINVHTGIEEQRPTRNILLGGEGKLRVGASLQGLPRIEPRPSYRGIELEIGHSEPELQIGVDSSANFLESLGEVVVESDIRQSERNQIRVRSDTGALLGLRHQSRADPACDAPALFLQQARSLSRGHDGLDTNTLAVGISHRALVSC